MARAAKASSSSEVPTITRFWFSQLVVAAIAPRFRPKPLTKPRPIADSLLSSLLPPKPFVVRIAGFLFVRFALSGRDHER